MENAPVAAAPETVNPDTHAQPAQSDGKVDTSAAKVDKKVETPAEAKKKWTLQVDKETIEKELTESETKALLQKAMAADKRFDEVNLTKKQIAEFAKSLKENPFSVLSHPELMTKQELRKHAEMWLASQIEEDLMDPKERELRDLKKWKEEQERLKEEEAKSAEQRELEERSKQYSETISQNIISALETSDLPKTPETISRIAAKMKAGIANGVRLEMPKIIELVRKDYEKDFGAVFGKWSPEQLAKFLGEEKIQAIRQWDNSRIKQPEPATLIENKKPRTGLDKVETWQDWKNMRRGK